MTAEPAMTVQRAASLLLAAESTAAEREPLTDDWPDLDLPTAYRIQDETLRRRLARDERTTGVKLGLTSRAKQLRMGVEVPLVAWLTDAMALPPNGELPTAQFIHPRAEPEIVLVLGERLAGPGVTIEAALAAVREVRGGIEVIDSRYRDFRFSLPDVVADNASSAAYLLGPVSLPPDSLDLAAEHCRLALDGKQVDEATGAAVLGHPAQALAFAANVLAERGLALEAGWLVLTGGLTDAVALGPGQHVGAHFSHLGSLTVHS